MSRYTWLLDPGHGGIIDDVYQTAGKRSPQLPDGRVLYEGDFNRDIVNRIIKFGKSLGVECMDIVDSLEDIPLRERVKRANEFYRHNKNCIYVSVHSNAFGNGKDFNKAKGICTFHHYRSSKGKHLAESLQATLAKYTNFRDRGVRSNDTWANFYVLRKTHMPAVLSENGFMTNLEDAAALLEPSVRHQIAWAHIVMFQEIEVHGF